MQKPRITYSGKVSYNQNTNYPKFLNGLDVELLEDDMRHAFGEGGVGAGVDTQPLVGELRVLRIVGGDDDDFLAGRQIGRASCRERV